jgi:hypothetical protein
VEILHGIWRLEGFNFEVIQFTPEMSIHSGLLLLANQLSLMNVVSGQQWMPWIALF